MNIHRSSLSIASTLLLVALLACGRDSPASNDGGASEGGVGEPGAPAAAPGVAPPLDRTIASDFASNFKFLYEGPAATQTGVAPGAVDARRMAVVRGRVLDANAQPVGGVTVAVPHEPGLGSTKTKADGTFDLVVNGGGTVIVAFTSQSHLPVQRKIAPVWNAFERAPDVFLTARDAKVTEVTLGSGGMQTASGSTVTDRSGERTGTLLFREGTSAEMVLADGSKRSLTSAHVRVTEYTAGDNGPKAMPATLPPQSGYTYAVELSIDEAESAGAREVSFSKPVPYYVENFLKFPVGEPVPAGFLDRQSGDWVAAESGRVIKVLSTEGGSAQIDGDGDDKADAPDALAALGVEAEELKTLATKYPAGTTLWRIPLKHFSAWDFNWCFFSKLLEATADLFDGRPLPDSCTAAGSVIECENQILGESLGVAGFPYALHYRSDRVPGRKDAYHFEVTLVGEKAPPEAKRVRFELDILGQHVTHVAPPTPNQTYTFDWDGKDVYGRVWQGPATVRYRVGYVFDGWYGHTPVFGAYGEIDRTRWERAPDNQFPRPPGVTAEDDLARLETTIWLPYQSSVLGTFDASALGFGGFTLGIHHSYDPASQTLYLGTGERRQATPDTRAVRAVLGAVGGKGDASGQGRRTTIDQPHGLAMSPDGTLYVSLEAQHKVVRVKRDGTTELVAGTGTAGYTGDGGPAGSATLSKPLGLALGRDGSLYIAERDNDVVRRVRPDGVIETFAGGSKTADDGAPKLAREAQFGEPHALAMGLDGSLFVVDSARNNVRRVRTDGIIETVLGSPTGSSGDSGDGGPGSKALLRDPLGAAVGPDGSLYVAEFDAHRIRRLTPDGTVTTVAGTGRPGFTGDGGPATMAQLNQPHTVDVGADGTIYIADEGNRVLRAISADGIIRTIAGGGQTKAEDFTPALDTVFKLPRLALVEPNGDVLVADYDGDFVYRVLPFLPTASPDGVAIASEDGSVYFQFDAAGRHLHTVDAYTHRPIWSFAYDAEGRLSSIKDSVGRAATIERDASGRATRLISPDGLASMLAYSDKGWLASVTDPAGEAMKFELSEGGLLLAETDAAGRVHSFAYDASGRLTKDTEASGSFQTLERSAGKRTVTKKNALGHSVTYARERTGETDKLTITGPDGLSTVRAKARATSTVVMPDGSSTSVQLKADPRFGMQAAYAGLTTVKLPSGATTEIKHTRTLTYSRPDDPTALATQTDRITTAAIGDVQTVYDAAARTLTTRARGDTTVTTYDELGRVVKFEPADRLTPTTYRYDAQGRLAEVTQGERSTKYSYDASGFLAQVTDASGVEYRYQRDAVGRPTSASAGQQQLYSMTYGLGGDLVALTTPSMREHRFAYDSGGRLSGYAPPSLTPAPPATIAYSYDADDAPRSVVDLSGKKVETQRDAAGRVTSIVTPEGAISLAYDAKSGALVQTKYGAESLAFTWDGPLPLSVTASGTVNQSVSVKYDAAMRPSEETIGSSAIGLKYDAQGRLTAVGMETLTYRDAQRISKRTLGVTEETYGYSRDFGELTSQEAKAAGASLYALKVTRDALGRIVEQQETVQGETSTRTFGYDALGRLVSVQPSEGAPQRFSYDANGNRIDANAVYDAQDRVLQYGDVKYEYTADGELLRRTDAGGTREYSYDSRGQLTKVASASATITYVIDPLGRRVAKLVDGGLRQALLYDFAGRVAAELDASGAVVSRFVYGSRAHVPDYILSGTSVLAVLSDPRGSPRLVVNTADGAVVQRIDYDAWGNVVRDTNPAVQPFRFAGGLWDPDTRLLRFGARDYDPELGRWTAKDPSGFHGGDTNLYAYAYGDPVNLIDIDGRHPILVPIIVGGATGAGIDIIFQLIENGGELGCIDWGRVGLAGLTGAAFNGALAGVARVAQAARAARGAPAFTQTTASALFKNGPFAGRSIGEVAAGLRSGAINPSQLPVDVIVRNGQTLALNTRSSLALTRAGIDPSKWTMVNRTGDAFFENLLTERLARNGLTEAGTEVLRITGMGQNASAIW